MVHIAMVSNVAHLPDDLGMEEISMLLPVRQSHSLVLLQKKGIGDLYRELVE